jgi:hypothetical protein
MKNLSQPTLDKRFQNPRSAILNMLCARVANHFGAAGAERNGDSKNAQNRRGAITGKLSGTKSRFSRGKRAGKVQIFTSISALLFSENKNFNFLREIRDFGK